MDEDKIAEDDRVPRVTSATWSGMRIFYQFLSDMKVFDSDRKYANGAIGSLTHALVLQGTKCKFSI